MYIFQFNFVLNLISRAQIFLKNINKIYLYKFYRAEGGKHVVVYNAIARKVLRIIKAEKGQNVSAEADRAEIERRLKFEKLVIVSC